MNKLITLPALLFFIGQISFLGRPAALKMDIVAGSYSSPADYFRSAGTGDWNNLSSWESSPDNINWSAAALIPTSAANTIYIRNGHTVTVSSNQDMDQVIIESGGILLHSANTLILNDGSGDDITIKSNGIFTLASNSNGPQFLGNATVNINTNGILRLSATGLTNAGTGVHASNYVYQHASVLEYTLNLAFASSGVTFFPNVNTVTIPVFRTTGNLGLIGSSSTTTINGLYEANGTVTFSNSGVKIFRNGMTGTGNIGNDGTSGKFIINGISASLGGTGSLTLPATGMDIGSNTTVTMISDKSVTGNMALLTNAILIMDSYNLVLTGDISGGSSLSHIVTNGTGKLVINNIAGVTPRIFPIGASATTYNPLSIYNGSGLSFGARVENGINPSIRYPVTAVNRTWVVNTSGNPPGPVNVNFFYSAGDGNALFNYSSAVEQGFYTGVWNVINTGLVQAGSYQVSTTVNSFTAGADAPMLIGNIPAILGTDNLLRLTVLRKNHRAFLNWALVGTFPVDRFSAERSSDAGAFNMLAEIPAGKSDFADSFPLPGLNYYRIKMAGKNGEKLYSNVVTMLNVSKRFELINISPNPVYAGNIELDINAAENSEAEMLITSMNGVQVQHKHLLLVAGVNRVPVILRGLPAGIYQLYLINMEERSRVLRFVVQ